MLSRVWLTATPWTVARQAPLSLGFSRQEHWRGLPFLFPGDLPDPGAEPIRRCWMNTWTRGTKADVKEGGGERRGSKRKAVKLTGEGKAILRFAFKTMRYFYRNMLSVGCRFIASPQVGRNPVEIWLWNCLQRLFINYTLQTALPLLSNSVTTFVFSSFPHASVFLYLPSYIVFLNFKLYASSYCLFGSPTSRRLSLDVLNKF